jgi:hypothetical protein
LVTAALVLALWWGQTVLGQPDDVAGQTPPTAEPQAVNELHGDLVPNGLALVFWSGGSLDVLRAVALARGCELASFWVVENGAFIGYLVGAPAVVNGRFLQRFPAALPSMPGIVRCGVSRLPSPAGGARQIEDSGCTLFPDDNPWATPVSTAPVHPSSDRYIAYILGSGGNRFLHADFGENQDYGIPYVVVPADQPTVPVTFEYADESDAGPYPLPPTVPIESGSDRHALVVRRGECKLYELFALEGGPAGWHAGSGAIFDLRSNALRPDHWTSADAAGLPIFAGLVRYDEVQRGRIDHALRFTVTRTQRAFIHPATHYASSITAAEAPPMGLRLRLRADFDRSRYHGQARVILDALSEYGMFVADNGSNWFISGAPSPGWNDTDLNQLKTVPGSAFEVVDTGPLIR